MIENKKILILGMARSGTSIAKLLSKYNNDLTITDKLEQDESLINELKNLNIKVVITDKQEELVDDSFDIIIKNPAIISTHLAVLKAKELNIEVINELEACFNLIPKSTKIIGITGSNGKTTTTTMIYEILKKKYNNVYLGGNIGTPLSSIVENIKDNSILVLEISDHQLCDMYKFKTNISVLTNLSQVHLDFHNNSYETYKSIKKRIFNNHTNLDYLDVINLSKDIKSKKLYFSKTNGDIYIKDNNIIYKDEIIININDIAIKGMHNYENIMATVLVCKLFNVENNIIIEYLK